MTKLWSVLSQTYVEPSKELYEDFCPFFGYIGVYSWGYTGMMEKKMGLGYRAMLSHMLVLRKVFLHRFLGRTAPAAQFLVTRPSRSG